MNKLSKQQLIQHLQNMINLIKENKTNQGILNYICGINHNEFKVSIFYNNIDKDCIYIGQDEK